MIHCIRLSSQQQPHLLSSLTLSPHSQTLPQSCLLHQEIPQDSLQKLCFSLQTRSPNMFPQLQLSIPVQFATVAIVQARQRPSVKPSKNPLSKPSHNPSINPLARSHLLDLTRSCLPSLARNLHLRLSGRYHPCPTIHLQLSRHHSSPPRNLWSSQVSSHLLIVTHISHQPCFLSCSPTPCLPPFKSTIHHIFHN